jgi:SAM-dependent methyltransferase
MNRRLASQSFGFDFSPEASKFWITRGLKRSVVASINDIPYPSDTFDVSMSVDVLESEGVDECRAVAELWRVTRPGGLILLLAPAYRWLLAEEHQRAVHAPRRYTRKELINLLSQQPVEIMRSTHLFAALFPLIAVYRLGQRVLSRHNNSRPHSDLRRLPTLVNTVFTRVMDVERQIVRKIDLPLGNSILVLGRKLSS